MFDVEKKFSTKKKSFRKKGIFSIFSKKWNARVMWHISHESFRKKKDWLCVANGHTHKMFGCVQQMGTHKSVLQCVAMCCS